MSDTITSKALLADVWWPGDYEPAPSDFWEFPEKIVAISTVGNRLFITLEGGRVIDATDLHSGDATKQ